MALIKCHECSKEISKTAKTCPNCGAKNKQKGIGLGGGILLTIVSFFVLIIICSQLGNQSSSSSSSSGSKKLSLTQSQEDYLHKLENDGYLSVEPSLNKASIAPAIWNNIDAKLKEDVSASLAIYCGNKKGTNLYWVEIYDKMSGRKLAKYSQSYGFKIY